MRVKVKTLFTLLLAVILIQSVNSCVDKGPIEGSFHTTNHVEDWRDEVIYQLITDRFADGDINNNHNVNRNVLTAWHGGDFQGIIDKIPYLKELGVTALWITPVVKNVEEDAGIAGYHGYWTQDFMGVNPHFGDLAKMREMVDALHDNDIKVILDIVANHVGQLFYYDMNKNGNPDDMLMGSNIECNKYCSSVMQVEDVEIGTKMCLQEYGAPFTVGGCVWDGCPNKQCFDRCMDRCLNEGYPQKIGLKRYTEWDPDFDPRGIRSFSEAGESGLAPVVWINMPEINRVPPSPSEFHNPDFYNRMGRITTWDSKLQTVRGDFPGGLNDLNTSKVEVQDALIKVFKYWISAANIDGFRIDTIKHVEHEFWQRFTPAMHKFAKEIGKENFFIFGEAFDGNDELLGSYTHNMEMDSVFYFSQKFQVFDSIFKWGGATKNFEKLYNLRMNKKEDGTPLDDGTAPRYGTLSEVTGIDDNGQEAKISPQKLMVNFMDNHDLPRFLYEKSDVDALKNAISLQLTMDGIPCIYYGTEQNYNGGNDPANRENLAISGFDTTNETFLFIKDMIALRKLYAPLRRGDMKVTWATERTGNEEDAGILAFERTYQGETVLVVINTHGEQDSSTSFGGAGMNVSFPAGTSLRDKAPGTDGAEFLVGGNGTIKVTVPKRSIRILVAAN